MTFGGWDGGLGRVPGVWSAHKVLEVAESSDVFGQKEERLQTANKSGAAQTLRRGRFFSARRRILMPLSKHR